MQHPQTAAAKEENVINRQLISVALYVHVCVCVWTRRAKMIGAEVQVRQSQIDFSEIKNKGGLCWLLLVEVIAQTDDLS